MNEDKINDIFNQVKTTLPKLGNLKDLETFKLSVLGKKGMLSQVFYNLSELFKTNKDKGNLPALIKVQSLANNVKKEIINLFTTHELILQKQAKIQKMEDNKEDIYQPPVKVNLGNLHPLTLIENEIKDILNLLGFKINQGPEVVTTNQNFTKLNIDKNHPAREEQDTLYFTPDLILRTHTSPEQIAILESCQKFPIKIIVPGNVYRNDDDDATHSHQFNQMEGLWVDDNVQMSDLKATLIYLLKKLFGKNIKTRFRPSHFPFTEPSAEVDMSCLFCQQKGCRICKYSGWIEVLGAGMVHPQVLKNCGINPQKYQGFAFGLGIDRLAMLKYKINDIRLFYTNDLRFLKQFNKEQ